MERNLNLYGQSNRSYEFMVYQVGSFIIPEKSGVYLFLKENRFANYQLLYIGETENFFDRVHLKLKYHQAWDCALKHGITHLGILPVLGGRQPRLEIETDLRNNYQSTPCNLQ